jgi:hypothetical protein
MVVPYVLGLGSGAGSALPAPALIFAGACTFLSVVVSAMSIYLQLKNYHKPILQRFAPHSLFANPALMNHWIRMVVRIMLMVPIYAVSSLISLFSLEAAFVIDAIRDIYEVRSNFALYGFSS